MNTSVPKVFLSYSHDSAEHKQWALDLATRLVHSGIDARIDAWEVGGGSDLPYFMETQLTEVDRVVMICTENYVEKANKGTGGVGYEKMIVTSSLMSNIDDKKIIPIIRQKGSKKVPTFLKTKAYIDFSNDDAFESVIDELMRESTAAHYTKSLNWALTLTKQPSQNQLKAKSIRSYYYLSGWSNDMKLATRALHFRSCMMHWGAQRYSQKLT